MTMKRMRKPNRKFQMWFCTWRNLRRFDRHSLSFSYEETNISQKKDCRWCDFIPAGLREQVSDRRWQRRTLLALRSFQHAALSPTFLPSSLLKEMKAFELKCLISTTIRTVFLFVKKN
ncbi:hypothetical protein CEXT_392141 [Caerostris extrusa]|uniref:Uncharacterized protein n=1 Tax=Caerostris extrusa TaxID=172846 RepID=A0AAV4P0B5_CAEEX|nr:hypothetical protein CEXT_392141 [Caerostris extrusa]